MSRAVHAIFPAILLASLFLVFLAFNVATPRLASANTEEQAAAPKSQSRDLQCSLGDSYSPSVRQWCGQIETYASQHGVEPALIAAVMLIESGGNPQAYSHSGAVGLMQVMPRDGLAASFQCASGPCFANRPSMQDLFDPEFNLDYASGMLSGLISRHGSLREALRAYGPMDVGYSYADQVLSVYNSY